MLVVRERLLSENVRCLDSISNLHPTIQTLDGYKDGYKRDHCKAKRFDSSEEFYILHSGISYAWRC